MRKPQRINLISSAAIVATVLSCVGVTGPGRADDGTTGPSAAKGLAIAQSLCVNCHLLPNNQTATVPSGVPTFRAIANRPGQTGEQIMFVLIKPHVPMPDMQISREEILSILAFLETLRTNPAVPPLLTPSELNPLPKSPRKT